MARRQKAEAEAKKREEQILDNLSAPPTKAQQKEMALRNALASGAVLTAAVCEAGGGGALAGFIAEGAFVAGGSTAVVIAAPVALAVVAGGMVAYHAMNSGPETTVEKDVAPPSGAEPKDQAAKNASDVKANENNLNQTSEAILKNGYYEVNGFKFTEYYYNRLWNMGRKAPSLIAKEILEEVKNYYSRSSKARIF